MSVLNVGVGQVYRMDHTSYIFISNIFFSSAIGFIRSVRKELKAISGTSDSNPSVELTWALLVALENGQGMDSAQDSDEAALHFLHDNTHRITYGTLAEINKEVKRIEQELGREIVKGEVHGLICVSCHVPILSATLKAASNHRIPVTGTGGTSLSIASATFPDLCLVGNAGGSVATTTVTKAISFSQAFAKEFGCSYSPTRKSWFRANDENSPSWKSILNACLPSFWGVALLKKFLMQYPRILPFLEPFQESMLEFLELFALPVTCSVLMATSVQQQTSPNTIMASVIAAAACRQSILSGLFAGWLAANLEELMQYHCIVNWNVPATMTNLLKTGLVGIITAIIVSPISQYTSMISSAIQNSAVSLLLEPSSDPFSEVDILRRAGLFVLGVIFCYGSKVGWYHSIFLPLILIEMERGGASFLGAIDQLTLVLVSAGICSGKWLTGSVQDVALVKRGLRTNLLCGDFIEVAYPYMEESILINIGGYLASGLSTAMLSDTSKSSAYLPLPLSLWLADDWKEMALASCIAFGVSFLFTLLSSLVSKTKEA